MTSAPMPTTSRKRRSTRPQALLAAGASECGLRLCQSADLRAHQPGRNHPRQSGGTRHHGAAACSPPSFPTTASMPISRWTSRPISTIVRDHAPDARPAAENSGRARRSRATPGHIYHGTIESFDNHIDAGSGTIRARARFANEDGSAGARHVRVGPDGRRRARTTRCWCRRRAIGNDQSKRFVFVVGAGDKAEYRAVALGADS